MWNKEGVEKSGEWLAMLVDQTYHFSKIKALFELKLEIWDPKNMYYHFLLKITICILEMKQFPPNMICQLNDKQNSSKNFPIQLAIMHLSMQMSKKWMFRTRGQQISHLTL